MRETSGSQGLPKWHRPVIVPVSNVSGYCLDHRPSILLIIRQGRTSSSASSRSLCPTQPRW